MYQPPTSTSDQNLPNGLPPHMEVNKQNILSQEKTNFQFNGVHSSHSSRSSSPLVRMGQIPTSQLPPTRPIPSSQLPPFHSPINIITHKVSGLGINDISPNVNPKFSTSTPNLQSPASFSLNSAFSPVVSTVPTPKEIPSGVELQSIPLTNANNGLTETVKTQPSKAPEPQGINLSFGTNQRLGNDLVQQPKPTGQHPIISSQFTAQVPQSSGTKPPVTQHPTMPLNQTPPNQPSVPNHQSSHSYRPPVQHNVLSNPQIQSQGFNPSLPQSNIQSVNKLQSFPLTPSVLTSTQSFNGPSQNLAPALVSKPQGFPPLQSTPISTQNYNEPPQNLPLAPTSAQNSSGTSQGLPLAQSAPNFSQTYNGPRQNLPSAHMAPTSTQSAFRPSQEFPSMQGAPNFPRGYNEPLQNVPTSQKPPNPTLGFNGPSPNLSSMQNVQSGSTLYQNYTSSQNAPVSTQGNIQGFTTPSQSFPPHHSMLQNQSKPPNLPQQNVGPPIQQPLRPNLHSNRYPVPPTQNIPQQLRSPIQQDTYPTQQQNTYQAQLQNTPNYGAQQQYRDVTQSGFNKLWGTETIDLLQNPNILPPSKVELPRIYLGQEVLDQANCSPDIFRCTMTKIPENNSLLQKSRLPLGMLIHPFRDLSHLPVIQCNVIVRCRACRTYINPFVMFVDTKRWKCNLCYRINELPEEFQYDPVTKTYGDPSRRPEIKSSTIEYIAPAEYMLRPPQPAVYLYLLDVSRLAIESGYLHSVCNILLEELRNLPGDTRTKIGFVTFDSALHFYSLCEGQSQPHEMTVLEIDDVFLPTPDNLLVNLNDRRDLVAELLTQLPSRYCNTFDNNSALGAALQVAYKMVSSTGGRVTVFQATLPNVGPGALTARENPSQRGTAEVTHLNPANDFYKRLALECSGQQIAVDLFVVNSTYVDIATISGISRFSGGCIHHFPLYKRSKALQCEQFERCFRRYLTRKIGFEAVMRVRCTRGLAIHTFHGNFFVRSTDLLSLPNINPDAGFGMQVAIEENLSDVQSVCFQAALLYTSSKGERRIRVHTVCLPIASTLHDILHSADQQCIVGLLSKMAVDRSMQSSLSDAREAFINVAIDILSSYKMTLNLGSPTSGLLAPSCLKLLPLYISALLKQSAFRTGSSTRLDDRVKAMIDMKTKPLYLLIQQIYPDLYAVHSLENQEVILNSEEEPIPLPPRLQLSARCLDSKGAFLMDIGEQMLLLVCPSVSQDFLVDVLGVPSYDAISDNMYEIPVINSLKNQRLHQFVNYLNEDKPYAATVQVIRDNSANRVMFLERLIEDRMENALSYHEFLQHLKSQVK